MVLFVVMKQSSVTSDTAPVFTTGESSRDSVDSLKEPTKTHKSVEVRMVVVWCERIEDKETVPWGKLSLYCL